MFGIGDNKVRVVARELLDLLQHYSEKYQRCSKEVLYADVSSLFPADHFELRGNSAQIAPPGFPDFQFLISADTCGEDGGQRQIAIQGRYDYRGFGLVAEGKRTQWFCYASDDELSKSTRAAKKLARLLDKEFGIPDTDRIVGL